MLELEHTTINYKDFIHELSEKLHTNAKEDFIELPLNKGKGFFKAVELPNGLQSLISDVEFYSDVLYRRVKNETNACTLHFNEVLIKGSYKFVQKGSVIEDKSERRTGVTLTSTANPVDLIVHAKTKSRTVNILLPKDWLAINFNSFSEMDALTKYTSFNNTFSHPEPFDAQYRVLFNEIFNLSNTHPMYNMMLKNRLMLLLEQFLSRIYKNFQTESKKIPNKIKTTDLSKLMEIESLLVKDFSLQPPTIISLAESADMSVSKLKTAFKKVYGTGIYEYYQKNRMQKARSLLLTGQFTVKEVGLKLGYTNLSNFSLAFRKQFGILPSQV